MNFIDLCAGIGGFSLGLEAAGMRSVVHIENNAFCTEVLNRHWPNVPVLGDIRDVKPSELQTADLVSGGFPCQPYSFSGHRKGTADDRDLWPAFEQILATKGPTWALFENVVGLVNLGLDAVLSQLESLGYTTGAIIVPAGAVGAWHRRDRVFILAFHQGGEKVYSDSHIQRAQRGQEGQVCRLPGFPRWEHDRGIADMLGRPDLPEPLICRGDDGFSARVDRITALGNAVVPQVVNVIGESIFFAHTEYLRGNV